MAGDHRYLHAYRIVRVNGRAKAVGGVKGKGAKAAGTQKKTLSKTESTKKVVKV